MRQRIALALCVLWVVGFELMPWAHIALHAQLAPHYHDASGAIVMLDGEPAAEADAPHVHTHVYPAPPTYRDREHTAHGHTHRHAHGEPEPGDDLARLAGALAHGRNSLAHHGIAIPMPPPVWLEPLPIDRRPSFDDRVVELEPFARAPDRAVCRGPPRGARGDLT